MGFSRQEQWSGLPFPPPKGTIERKKVNSLSRVRLSATPWTAAHQAPPSMGFSRQEYWSGLPLPSPFKLLLNFFFFSNLVQILKWFVYYFWYYSWLYIPPLKSFLSPLYWCNTHGPFTCLSVWSPCSNSGQLLSCVGFWVSGKTWSSSELELDLLF